MQNIKYIRKTVALTILIIPTLAVLFNVCLLIKPQEALTAAREGVSLWFNQVLPSLLPFMIGVNILSGMGVSRFMAALLAPVMKPLFGLPGAGGFALLMGIISGYPMGAKLTAELRSEGQLTQEEAQRLMGFCNNAGPLFIVGVAGAGLFGSAAAGYVMWLSHVAAALTVGILSHITARKPSGTEMIGMYKNPNVRKKNVLRQAFSHYRSYRRLRNPSLGQVLGESVKDAMDSIAVIGGFIIFFCVVTQLSKGLIQTDITLANGLWAGLLEATNGIKTLAGEGAAFFTRIQLAAAAGVISFGGFSIHAQSLYMIKKTDIKALPYLAAKLLQAVLAAALCAILYPLSTLSFPR